MFLNLRAPMPNLLSCCASGLPHQDQHISLRVGVWKDPEAWGMMLADLARHISAAFEQAEKRDPVEMLARIKAGFDAEMDSPTDDVRGELAG